MSDGAERGLVSGRVMTSAQTSVARAAVTAFDVGLGREQHLGDGVSDDDGIYTLSYDLALVPKDRLPDLLVRVSLHGKPVGASAVLYNAPPAATVNVVVDARTVVQGDEHSRLVQDLAPHIDAAPDRQRLADLTETPERRDITYLANKTGWDARAVAMAAAADQVSMGTEIPGELFYALFRAGLPADRDALARTRPEQASKIWKQAIADGVLRRELGRSLAGFTAQFAELAADALLHRPAPVGVSSLDEILDIAGLDGEQKHAVASAYSATTDRDTFWSRIEDQLGAETAARVATVSRLGYLTVNNAPLMAALADRAASNGGSGPDDLVGLVRTGLYEPDAWAELVEAVEVPSEIPGSDEAERRANYAELLASQLQISYPTAVVGAMVERKALSLAEPRAAGEVTKFLAEHQGRFELGQQPVQQYLRDNGLDLSERATRAVTTLQRQYQLTPSNQALQGLATNRIDSALAATRYGHDEFVARFADAVGGATEAMVIYAKAQQIHATALNVATNYLLARTSPSLHAVPATLALADGTNGVRTLGDGNLVEHPTPAAVGTGTASITTGATATSEAPRTTGATATATSGTTALDRTGAASSAGSASDVVAYATLEQLFGELDYCACTHCRSVLSPAAYLVDLLLFCDRRRFNAAGQELPAEYELENPLDVLLSRRPDIAELKLTCQNTNVALPYVDLVNEVLEHYVVHQSLDAFTGHDVAPDQTSQDLIASPRHVDPAAYTVLAGEKFPLALPFERPLAGLRAYLGRAGPGSNGSASGRDGISALAALMETVRRSDAMLPGGGNPYGWRDILIERLDINRGEHALLTDGTISLADLYGTDTTSDAATIAVVGNAKAFARRLGLSYEDVVAVTRTRFVNPESWLLGRLDRLALSFDTIKGHHDGQITDQQLEAMLPPGLDTAPYGDDPKQWLADHYGAIGTLVVLSAPDGADLCSFDDVRFRHALDDTELTPVEARRLLRFVRLWRRLGWSIGATDRAVVALWPAAQRPQPGDDATTAAATKLDVGMAEALLRLGHLRAVMARLGLSEKRDLPRALVLWAPIDTVGSTSLYHRLFLAPSILALDPVFAEGPDGQVLAGSADLTDHKRAIEAACRLKTGELDVILEAVGFDDQTDLTVANLSVVLRWAILARQLGLSPQELVALREMTGIGPFDPPASPRPPLVRFLNAVDRLRAVALRVPLLMYLLRHDLRRGAPQPADLVALAKRLHDDLGRIEQENALVEDPDGEVARAGMAAVYGQPAADTFLALVTGTVGFDVRYAQTQPSLHSTVSAAAPGLRYDHLAKRLHHAGLLSEGQRDVVQALAAATPALATAVADLHLAGQQATRQFFAAHPELETLYDTVMAGPAAARTASILGAVLPQLRGRLQELHLVQAVASDTDLAAADVSRLLGDAAVLHRIGAPTEPALEDLRAIARSGASMAVYDGPDTVGTASTTAAAVEVLDYARPDNPLPANSQNPAGVVSGVWRWRLDPPANGFYSLFVQADPGATVELRVDGRTVALAQDGDVWESQDPVELTAGVLPEVRLTVKGVRDRLAVRWQAAGLAREVVPTGRMLPADLVDRFAATYVRLLKALALAAQLELDGEELAWFATRPQLAIGGQGWLNALPVDTPVLVATVQGLFTGVLQLAAYAQLRRELQLREHRLLDLLRDPTRAGTDPRRSARAEVTGWPDSTVTAVLAHLGLTAPDLDDPDALRQVKAVLDAADDVGVPAEALLAAVTNAPTEAQLGQLQAALRARYDDDTWPDIVQPVNDVLRDQQRDALVAHVLHQLASTPATAHIDTANKLFEWFLIDVEMEPCMRTSRIRQALSSVQLFVQRCLLNLEPRVAPSSIDPQRWAWMQRYRVWEANRRVFLTPENWLEPELRDDKSPLFRRLESELLAADITDDSAARALGHYLEGLAEVASLEVEGLFVEEHASGAADDVVHVVARTSGARRAWYYRRQSRGAWTPWEPVPLDIEDGPAVPVVWRGRRFLFWLRVLDGAATGQGATTAPGDTDLANVKASQLKTSASRRMLAMLQWSEHVNGAWLPPSTSDPANPIGLNDVDVDAFDRTQLTLGTRDDSDGSLIVDVGYGTRSTYFRLYTPHSLPIRASEEPPAQGLIMVTLSNSRMFRVGKGLGVDYFAPDFSRSPDRWSFRHDVLARGWFGRVVEPRHPLGGLFVAPFFYQDRRHVLYVRPATSIVRVPEYSDLGIQPEAPTVSIPDFPEIRWIPEFDLEDLLPDTGDPYPEDVYHGGFEVTPAGVHVANPNIRTEIAAVGTFVFGDQVIAPSGAVELDGKGAFG